MDSPSQAQEKRVAKLLGGSVQPGSGNGWMRKGDVRTDEFLIECKTTAKQSYRLTLDVLETISREALMDSGRDPVLFVEMDGSSYVVLNEDTFMMLFEQASAYCGIQKAARG